MRVVRFLRRNADFITVIGLVVAILLMIGVWDARRADAATAGWSSCPTDSRTLKDFIYDAPPSLYAGEAKNVGVSGRMRYYDCWSDFKPFRLVLRQWRLGFLATEGLGGWPANCRENRWRVIITDSGVVAGLHKPYKFTFRTPCKYGKFVKRIYTHGWGAEYRPRFCLHVTQAIRYRPDAHTVMGCRAFG